jgi:hypothetical protein
MEGITRMNKKELIAMIKDFPDNMDVVFSYPSRDYWHSVIAKEPQNIETGLIEYSAYHSSNVVSSNQDETENTKEVIIIS